MGTKTMYETIMDLPLFKGLGTDHISSFLEKTSIEFHRFSSGDIIVEGGAPVKTLRFLISGRIRCVLPVLHGRLTISSEFEGQDAIGVTRLFGMHPHHEATVTAVNNVGIMEFSKDKYVKLLRSDSIYLMNFANLLSLNVQKTSQIFPDFTRLDLARIFAEWVVLFTVRKSEDIAISSASALRDIYGESYVERELQHLTELSLIRVEDDRILVPDRDALIEYASEDLGRDRGIALT